jgi:hypothetical protein
LVKTVKEKLAERIKQKEAGFLRETKAKISEGAYGTASLKFLKGLFEFLIILIGVLGFGAAQFCTFGSPVCAVSVGTAIVTAIFPSAVVSFLFEYGLGNIAGDPNATRWIISDGVL